jgi:hypothetical protein
MREISQAVFAHFRRVYIETGRNFLAEANATPAQEFVGGAGGPLPEAEDNSVNFERTLSASDQVEAVRSSIKSFVIYQLCNSKPPNGSGVGCGFYDETGSDNKAGIAGVMNAYVFGVCFNPALGENNRLLFADYCLTQLESAVFARSQGGWFIPTKANLTSGFDESALCDYWQQHRAAFDELLSVDRRVVTTNYVVTYKDALPGAFQMLDEMLQARLAPPAQESDQAMDVGK